MCIHVCVCVCIYAYVYIYKGFPGGSVVKNLLANAGATGDSGWITGSGRSPRGRHGNPLQYSCLKNSMDRGEVWWAIVHGGHKESDMIKQPSMHAHVCVYAHTYIYIHIHIYTHAYIPAYTLL